MIRQLAKWLSIGLREECESVSKTESPAAQKKYRVLACSKDIDRLSRAYNVRVHLIVRRTTLRALNKFADDNQAVPSC